MQQPSFDPRAASAIDASPADQPGASIRYGDALRFAFRAEKPWMNILIASVFAFIPVAGPIALGGWHCEIMQRLVRRHPTPIPTLEFTDFTHFLTRGVQPFVARVLLSLPLTFILLFVWMIAGVAAGVTARTHGDPSIVIGIYGLVFLGFLALTPIFAIVAYALYTRADLTEEITHTFKVAPLTHYVRATWLTVLGSAIVFGMISFGVMLAGFIACYFGAFVASAIIQLGQLHLRWQIYERYLLRGGEPIAPKAPVMLPSEQARANPYAPYAHAPMGYPPPPPPVYPQPGPPQPPFYPPR